MAGTDPKDPLVALIFSPVGCVLAVVSADIDHHQHKGRVVECRRHYTDVQLTMAGVWDLQYCMSWDGLGHGAGTPRPTCTENKEADTIIVKFFDKHPAELKVRRCFCDGRPSGRVDARRP